MRVAVILTGHMRCWEQVYPKFKERVIDKYNPDIFIHTWEDEAYWDPHSRAGIAEGTPKVDAQRIFDTYKPTILQQERWSDMKAIFENRAMPFVNYYHVPKNIISMLYKMHAGVSLMEQHVALTGKYYDLVIRMRPDLVFNQDLPDFDPAYFYTLGFKNHMGKGTSDMIQVGSMFSVSLFSKLILHLPILYEQTKLLCPHELSEHYIKSLGIPWKEFMIDKTIMHTPKGEYVPKQVYMT